MKPTPGKSLKPLFENRKLKKPFNEFILIGKERHDVGRPDDLGYPIRGIIHNEWLYLINYRSDLWPAGNPQTGYQTVGGSPTKTLILNHRKAPDLNHFWKWSFGKRPEEEMYDLKKDPYCLNNLAKLQEYDETRVKLKEKMETELKLQEDPRMFGQGDIFQNYPFIVDVIRNAYEKIVIRKEDLVLWWINRSDMDPDFVEE